MQNTILERIEADMRQLPLTDQLWLMERLAAHIRQRAGAGSPAAENQLAAMAQDPQVQRELRRIEAEFAGTETDGLDAAA